MFAGLIDWLPRSGADVLCLQEVTRTPGLGGWTHFEDTERTLPQRADLFDDVAAALPGHRGRFVASDTGPVRDGQSGIHQQDFGLAVFVDKRIGVIGAEESFVHGSYVAHGRWPTGGRPRAAQGVRLADPESDRVVTIVHLHGLRDPAGKADTPARRIQAEHLAELVRDLRAPQDLTVVCGDLNLLPDSETFDVLRKVGLVDLVGAADTRTSSYAKPVRHANYLLVSDPSAVAGFEILAEPEVSDHRALVLDL